MVVVPTRCTVRFGLAPRAVRQLHATLRCGRTQQSLHFLASPRLRTLTNPNFSFITANTCSTLDSTRDLVRFFAR